MIDVVVIGAGIGGLSAAVHLATAGLEVAVVEAGPRVGGKADELVVDGAAFDTGPSVLTMPEVFDAIFERAGASFRERVGLVEPEPAFRYLYPDGAVVDVSLDPGRTLRSVGEALGPAARGELEAFLAHTRRIWESAAPWFVHGPAPDAARLAQIGARALPALAHLDAHRSMWTAIRRTVRDERLRWLLARYATYNGSDVRVAPATLNCIAWVELGLGGYGVRGGMHRLAEALGELIVAHGGAVHLGRPVDGIALRGGRVAGVRLADGTALAARAVVANADVAHLVADLLPTAVRGRVRAGGPPSTSGFTAVVRSRRRPGRAAHTVAFPAAYLDEFADLFDRERPPEDPTVYACAQGVAHGRPGWGEEEPVFLMANAPALRGVPPGDEAYARLRDATLARAVAAGIVGGDEPVVWTRTPAGLARRYPRTGGAIYGASSNHPLAAFRRPHNRVRAVPGLYLASGSAHPGGGVPMVALSGREAARALLADLGRAL